MKKYLILFFIAVYLTGIMTVASFGNAADCELPDCVDPFAGTQLNTGQGDEAPSPLDIVNKTITNFLSVVGALALLFIVYAGLQYMISRGDTTKIQEAQKTLTWAIIGLIIIFGAYAINSYIFDTVATTTTEGPSTSGGGGGRGSDSAAGQGSLGDGN